MGLHALPVYMESTHTRRLLRSYIPHLLVPGMVCVEVKEVAPGHPCGAALHTHRILSSPILLDHYVPQVLPVLRWTHDLVPYTPVTRGGPCTDLGVGVGGPAWA